MSVSRLDEILDFVVGAGRDVAVILGRGDPKAALWHVGMALAAVLSALMVWQAVQWVRWLIVRAKRRWRRWRADREWRAREEEQ